MSAQMDLGALAAAVEARGVPAVIEHTGGGVYTLFAGTPSPEHVYGACAGPAQAVGERIVFDLAEFYVGPDENGNLDGPAAEHYTATADDTLDTLAERIVALAR